MRTKGDQYVEMQNGCNVHTEGAASMNLGNVELQRSTNVDIFELSFKVETSDSQTCKGS
jgi:hypothetical protein